MKSCHHNFKFISIILCIHVNCKPGSHRPIFGPGV